MRTVFILLFLLGKQVTQGAVQSDNSEGENCNDQSINVVSFVNTDPGSVKEYLVDVQCFFIQCAALLKSLDQCGTTKAPTAVLYFIFTSASWSHRFCK